MSEDYIKKGQRRPNYTISFTDEGHLTMAFRYCFEIYRLIMNFFNVELVNVYIYIYIH